MINNVDFVEIEAEKYWSFPPKYKGDKKKEIRDMIFSGEYFGSVKKDGHYYRFIKDGDILRLQGRSKSVSGEYLNKIDWVPHIKDELEVIPDGTVLLGELYFPFNPGSKKVTTVMGCLKEKAIQRQKEEENKLHYYIFDVWAYDGKSMLNETIEHRINLINKINGIFEKSKYIEVAEYYSGEKLWNKLGDALSSNEEGIVITREGSIPEPGKRTARKTIKIKKELNSDLDVFLTGNYKRANKEYDGKNITEWKFWYNVKTDEKLYGDYYSEFFNGSPIEPVKKTFFYGWASSVEIGAYDPIKDEIIHIGYISNVSDKVKEEIILKDNNWILKPCKVTAMEIDDESNLLRHAKIIEFREDISWKDCTVQKIFGEKE